MTRYSLGLVRSATMFVSLAFFLVSADAKVQIHGKVRTRGIITPYGYTGLNQYTHIWVFTPPNGTGGGSFNDNANFVTDVMNNSSITSIDGASLPLAWSTIEDTLPSTTPCVPSDTCQPDPGAIGMYHSYDWRTYDSTTSGNPIYQWISLSGKRVNLLINAQQSGMTNPVTPHYVTSAWWYSQFNPERQDVINAVKDCPGTSWAGTAGTVSSWSGTTVTVNASNCCSTTATQNNTLQTGDTIWVTSSTTGLDTPSAGSQVTVNNSGQFYYTASGMGTASGQSLTYVSAAQSWAVPYEYPYKSALKALWAAVVAHYGLSFTLNGTNYYPQLNYFRFGGSVGSEWYPYCTSGTNGGVSVGLKNLSSPYTYVKSGTDANHVGWLDFYQEMGSYLQSLGPPWQVIHSINAADTPTDYTYGDAEAGYAVSWSNRFGVRDGFGSQGLSVQDYLNCNSGGCPSPGPPNSASDWYPMFQNYKAYGVPLELQPIALSFPNDTNCTNGCSPTTFSGDLPTFLNPFTITPGATDVEIYWRDVSLAYDGSQYCVLNTIPPITSCTASVSPGGQIVSPGSQFIFFQGTTTPPQQGVGIGSVNPYCSGTPPQSHAIGDCHYSNNVGAAHGQH